MQSSFFILVLRAYPHAVQSSLDGVFNVSLVYIFVYLYVCLFSFCESTYIHVGSEWSSASSDAQIFKMPDPVKPILIRFELYSSHALKYIRINICKYLLPKLQVPRTVTAPHLGFPELCNYLLRTLLCFRFVGSSARQINIHICFCWLTLTPPRPHRAPPTFLKSSASLTSCANKNS